MVEIERIDKQLDKFDKRMTKNEEYLQETNIKLERNNILTEQNNITMEKFSQTLEDTSNTMREIGYVIKQVVNDQVDIKESVKCLNDKINCQVEKGKFDFLLFFKQNFVGVMIAVFIVLDKVGVIK